MSDRITNRYFGSSVPKLPHNFKEFSLAIAPTTVHSNIKALWNGGDGYDWVIVRPKIYNIFVSKSLERFLDGTEPIPYNLNPPTQEQFVNPYIDHLTATALGTRDNLYASLRARFNLPNNGWNDVGGVNTLAPQNQDIFWNTRFSIENEYQKAMYSIPMQHSNKVKEWREMISQNRRDKDKYIERQERCNRTFREVFGPVALSYIEDMINAKHFDQAWNRINQEYSTVQPDMIRSGILDKLSLIQYDMEHHTVGSLIQLMEQTWEPLIINGGFSDDEKIKYLKKAFKNHESLFSETFGHCRRMNYNYAQTRDMILREVTLKMTEMANEHNMVEYVRKNYRIKEEKIYSVKDDIKEDQYLESMPPT